MNISEWDFEVEGDVIRWWQVIFKHPMIAPEERTPQQVRDEFEGRMVNHIRTGREAGLEDAAMRRKIEVNLFTYTVDPKTAPIDDWFAAASYFAGSGV